MLSFKEGINTSAKHLVVGSYHRIVATLQLLLFSDYDSVVLYRNYLFKKVILGRIVPVVIVRLSLRCAVKENHIIKRLAAEMKT